MDIIKDKLQYSVNSRRTFMKIMGSGLAAAAVAAGVPAPAGATGKDLLKAAEEKEIFLHGANIRIPH